MAELEFILEPSFIVTWVKFRRRNLLEKLDARYYILEDFFNVFSWGKVVRYLLENLGKLFTIISYSDAEISDIREKVYQIIGGDKRLCVMSGLGIKIIAIAVQRDLRVLSDNICIHKFATLYWDPKMVWTSIDLLTYMREEGIIDDLEKVLQELSTDANAIIIKTPEFF